MKFIGSLFCRYYPARWLASIILLFLLDICTYMAFRDGTGTPLIPHQDKVTHVLAFFVLTIAGHVSIHFDFFPQLRKRVIAMCINAAIWLAYGVFIELVQRVLSYRTFSFADIAADATGIAAATFFSIFVNLSPRSADSHGKS